MNGGFRDGLVPRPPQPTRRRRARKALLDEFEHARGDALDRQWADRALGRLAHAEVEPELQREIVASALGVVRESGEAADELFGPAEWWAASQIEERVAQGLPTFAPTPIARWRDLPGVGLVWAATIYASITVHCLIYGVHTGPLAACWALSPLIMGLVLGAAPPLFDTVLQRARLMVAMASVVGVVLAGIVLAAALFALGERLSLGIVSVWWALVPATVCGLLSWPFLRRSRRQATTAPEADDDQWLRRFVRALRLRLELPESRVRELLAEAAAYDREPGVSLIAEFGSPEVYAERFEADPKLAGRRQAAFGLSIVVGLAVGMWLHMDVSSRWPDRRWASSAAWILIAVGTGRVMRLMRIAQRGG